MSCYTRESSTVTAVAGAPNAASSPFARMLSPYTRRSHQQRNRVVHASMSTCYTKDAGGTDPLIHYHGNRAAGGAVMIVTGALLGLESQRGGYRVHVFSDDHVDDLKRWAAAVVAADCRILGQLVAPGRARHHPGCNDNAVGLSADDQTTVIAFLVSREADFVNATTVDVTGGQG